MRRQIIPILCLFLMLSVDAWAKVTVKALCNADLASMSEQAKLSLQQPTAKMVLSMYLVYIRDAYQLPFIECVKERKDGAKPCVMGVRPPERQAAFGLDMLMHMFLKVRPRGPDLIVNIPKNPYTGDLLYFQISPTIKNNKVTAWTYIGPMWDIDYVYRPVKFLDWEGLVKGLGVETQSDDWKAFLQQSQKPSSEK